MRRGMLAGNVEHSGLELIHELLPLVIESERLQGSLT